MKQMNQRDAIHYIATQQEFKASALSGHADNTQHTGRLEGSEAGLYRASLSEIDYTVMSYGTPIAWHTLIGWYVVEQKFSSTTSKHQNYVRQAIAESMEIAV
jgi:hypothetical protein